MTRVRRLFKGFHWPVFGRVDGYKSRRARQDHIFPLITVVSDGQGHWRWVIYARNLGMPSYFIHFSKALKAWNKRASEIFNLLRCADDSLSETWNFASSKISGKTSDLRDLKRRPMMLDSSHTIQSVATLNSASLAATPKTLLSRISWMLEWKMWRAFLFDKLITLC